MGKISRRNYIVGGAIAAGAAVAGGYYYLTRPPEEPEEPEPQTPLEIAIAKVRELWDEDIESANFDWRQCEGETIKVLGQLIVPEDEARFVKEYVTDFEALTGITVDVDFIGEYEMRQKTTLDLLSGTGIYDIVKPDNMHMGLYAKEKVLVPLNEYFYAEKWDPDWFDWDNDFYPASRQSASPEPWSEGNVYYLPEVNYSKMFFYRKDLLAAKGFTSPPETYDDVAEIAQECHDPANEHWGFVSRGIRGEGLNVYTFSTVFRAFGANWFDEDWIPLVNSEEAVDALQWYYDTLTDYGPPGVVNYGWTNTTQDLWEGRAVQCLDGCSWIVNTWDATRCAPEAFEQVYETRCPMGKGGRHAGFFSWGYGINEKSQHKDASWLWLAYKFGKYGNINNSLRSGACSRASFWDIPECRALYEYIDDVTLQFPLSLQYDSFGNHRPVIPEWPEVGDLMGITISSVLAQELTPQEGLDDLYTKWYNVMKDAGYYD